VSRLEDAVFVLLSIILVVTVDNITVAVVMAIPVVVKLGFGVVVPRG
jgi:hypothetical protein